MKEPMPFKPFRHLNRLGAATLVFAGSLLLLFYITQKEAAQIYPPIQLEKVANQGKILRTTMEGFLKAGVPLHQYAGFTIMAQHLLEQVPILDEIQVVSFDRQLLYSTRESGSRHTSVTLEGFLSNSEPKFLLDEAESFYQVLVPLRNKFEPVGGLVLIVSKDSLMAPLEAHFNRLVFYCLGLVVLFFLLLVVCRIGHKLNQRMVLVACYVPFLIAGGALMNRALGNLKAQGVRERTETLAHQVAHRLDVALELGLSLDDFEDLDQQLTMVSNADPHLAQLACVRGSELLLGTMQQNPASKTSLAVVPLSSDPGVQVVARLQQTSPNDAFWSLAQRYANSGVFLVLLSCMVLLLLDRYMVEGFQTLKVPATFVLSLALVLLYYVGLGEAYRGYPKLQLEKLAAQGESLRQGMEGFLRGGVPLRQFGGFRTLAGPLLRADRSIYHIQVVDSSGLQIYAEKGMDDPFVQKTIQRHSRFAPLSFKGVDAQSQSFSESVNFYQVCLPLHDKFEQVGSLLLTVNRRNIEDPIQQAFAELAKVMVALIICYILVLWLGERFLARHTSWPHVCYGSSFLIAAGFVVVTLTGLYSSAIEAKTRALSISLSKRLDAATSLGLSLEDFADLDATFQEYIRANPELNAIALVKSGMNVIHTDRQRVGQSYEDEPYSFTHTARLSMEEGEPRDFFSVSLSIPRKQVWARLLRSIKNFLVLFVATALLAMLFLNMVSLLSHQRKHQDQAPTEQMALTLIKVLYFLVVFVEGLFASFLPLYLQEISSTSDLGPGAASRLFTAYFAAFALSLIPSGKYADRHGVKMLMIWGVLLTAFSAYGMTLVDSFYPVMLLRVLAGVSQGMIFIGVQSFILQVTARDKTTQGTSIIVYGYNTGMISGTAIGALLVLYLGSTLVFRLGAAISLFIFAFILLIPNMGDRHDNALVQAPSKSHFEMLKQLGILFRDLQFINTIALIGLTTKATMTGIVVYALPLVMARLGYPQDDIGQMLMFYAAGVLLSNVYIPKLTDRLGNTGIILFWGSIGSGLGLVCMALIGLPALINLGLVKTAMLIVGIFLLGIAHGFIHAPIVTHVAYTRSASILGKSTTTSIYRFLERIGHVIGPIIVGHILIISDYSTATFGYVGVALLIFGLTFVLLRLPDADKRTAITGDTR